MAAVGRSARSLRARAGPGRFPRGLRLAFALALLPTLLLGLYRFVPPPVTPLMLLRWAEGDGLDVRWRPLAELPPSLARAVVAAEDNWFCRHRGFDWAALQAQLEIARAGERPRGASTITQQTAKNVLLWPGRDPVRKVLEAWFASQLELLWGKRRILEVYLNVVELGPGVFGAEAAARHWFERPAAELSARQTATLAALLPNPRAWTPDDPHVQEKAAVVLDRIGQLGLLLDCLP